MITKLLAPLAGAGIAVAAGAAIAATVLLTLGASTSSGSTPDANGMTTVTTAPPPWTSPTETPAPATPFVMPPDVPVAHETQDGAFLQKIYEAGWDASGDRATAIDFAHATCDYLAYPDASIGTWAVVEQIKFPRPYGVAGYLAMSKAAVSVYCPGLA